MKEVDLGHPAKLESFHEEKRHAHLTASVEQLLRHALPILGVMQQKRIWIFSSTSRGGGVAEMMPRFLYLLREFGVKSRWLIISDTPDTEAKFFSITKKIHNNIHGDGEPLSTWRAEWLSEGETNPLETYKRIFEDFNRRNCDEFFDKFCPDFDPETDIIIVHDPQPSAMAKYIRERYPRYKLLVWRCHVGLDTENDATRAAWAFLEPYITLYDKCVFSAKDYVRSVVQDKSVVIFPGISPLSDKNTELSPYEVSQVLLRAGLMAPIIDVSERTPCGVIEEQFEHTAKIYGADSSSPLATPIHMSRTPSSATSSSCAPIKGRIAFLHRPVVLQVSRWDRLKGWAPLLDAWVLLKQNAEHYAQHGDRSVCTAIERCEHNCVAHTKLIQHACLVLAGPDPAYIQDDPEGLTVLQQLKEKYDGLPPEIQRDVKIIELPMESAEENALIVNALQRASMVVVQNSLREGFGLTATEALFKRVCFIGTEQACGLRTQVRNGVDGLLIKDDPSDPSNVAETLSVALSCRAMRERLAVNGQKRAYDEFLIYSQIQRWMDMLAEITSAHKKHDGLFARARRHMSSKW